MSNHLNFIMAFEGGELESREELIAGFQALIDDGTVWKLQGMYGRVAFELIGTGECRQVSRLTH